MEEVVELKERLYEASEEVRKMKILSTATQDEVEKLTDQFAGMMDGVKAFRTEVFDRCQDYVDHAAKVNEKLSQYGQLNDSNIEKVQELEEALSNQADNMQIYESNMKHYFEKTSEVILDHLEHRKSIEDLESGVAELKQWQEEMNNSQGKIKIEKESDSEESEEEPEESEDENEDENIKPVEKPERKVDEKSTKSVSQRNKQLKYEWYEYSSSVIPDEYKLQYVHANAEDRNEKIIYKWYDDCRDIGILTDEFQPIPEETE